MLCAELKIQPELTAKLIPSHYQSESSKSGGAEASSGAGAVTSGASAAAAAATAAGAE